MSENKRPLYVELKEILPNEPVEFNATQILIDEVVAANFTTLLRGEFTAQVLAQYTALAVNNLHHLAEALQGMINDFEQAYPRLSELGTHENYKRAKEALSRIS